MSSNEILIDELKELTEKFSNANSASIEKILKNLVQISTDDYLKLDLKDIFLDLLLKNKPSINILVIKCTAEATKHVSQRSKFSNGDILQKLMDIFDDALSKRGDMDLINQLCRALGNIFYSNDDSRNIVFHQNGGRTLIKLLDVSNEDIQKDDLLFFSKVRSGVLSNYLLGNEELSQKAIEDGIIGSIKARILDIISSQNDETLFQHLLPILCILIEQVTDLILSPDIIECIVKIFKSSNNADVIDTCLELMQSQAENDEVKLLLAKENVCEHIIKSIDMYKSFHGTVDYKSLVKLSCDLIVLILTGDEAMHYLDETTFLSHIKEWLDSSDDYLITTSVLSLGNFARTDNHCIKMVQDNILLKLMEILKKSTHQKLDDDTRLQHALLSAIRNLVIPKENKQVAIQSGLVDTIIPMLYEEQQPVIFFKIFGTLRMLVDGQHELPLTILKNGQLLEKCVEWAFTTPDMVGVNSEASRLLASLIKNAYRLKDDGEIDSKLLMVFVSTHGAINVLVKMLSSAHVIMQNEGILALILFAIHTEDREKLSNLLIEANIADAVSDFIGRISETERMTNEIIDNLITLIRVLKKNDTLKNYLDQKSIDENAIPRLKELATL